MYITWEDRKGRGSVDNHALKEKPVFSFEYAWFLVTETSAQFVESHEYGYWNEDMSEEQRLEVVDFYESWSPPVELPVAEPEPLPPEEVLSSEMDQASYLILSQREQAFSEGVPFDFDGTPDRIQVRDGDRANILGVLMAAERDIAAGRDITRPFRSASNVTYQLTPAQMVSLGETALAGIDAIYQASWDKKDQVKSLVDGFESGDDLEAVLAQIQAIVDQELL